MCGAKAVACYGDQITKPAIRPAISKKAKRKMFHEIGPQNAPCLQAARNRLKNHSAGMYDVYAQK